MNLGCLKKLAYTRVAPFENIDNPLNLSVRMTLLTVREMTEKMQTLVSAMVIVMNWTYTRVTQNSLEYGGIKTLQTTSGLQSLCACLIM